LHTEKSEKNGGIDILESKTTTKKENRHLRRKSRKLSRVIWEKAFKGLKRGPESIRKKEKDGTLKKKKKNIDALTRN